MGEHTQSTEVIAPSDALFDYLADVGNLANYFDAMIRAERVGDQEVHTVAEVHGTRREGTAWFQVDAERNQLRWGSEGDSGYRGRLDVTGDLTSSTVTVSLHTERTDDPEIDQGITETLATIKEQIESSYASPS